MTHWWRRKRKIAQLPSAERAVVTALASTMEKAQAGHVKSVYIGIQWEDDTFDADWSSMTRADLAAHALVAQSKAMKEID